MLSLFLFSVCDAVRPLNRLRSILGNVGNHVAEVDKASEKGENSQERRREKNNNTWPPTYITILLIKKIQFQGGSQTQHGAKTILKAIDKADHSAKCFWETSHGSMQGRQCAQQFYWLVSFCLCFFFFFALWGLFDSSARPVTEFSKGCHHCEGVVLDVNYTAGPPNYEWMNMMNECLTEKKRKKRTFGEIHSENPKCWHTVDDVCMKLYCYTDIEYNQFHPKRQHQSINQPISQSISHLNVQRTTVFTPYRWYKCLVTLYEVNISVSV